MRHKVEGSLVRAGVDAVSIVSRETSLESESLVLPLGNVEGKASLKVLATEAAKLVPECRRARFRDRYGAGWSQGPVRYTFLSDAANIGRSRIHRSQAKLAVTGELSEKVLMMALESLADDDKKLTRLDLFCDVRLELQTEDLSRKMYDKMPAKIKSRARLVESATGGTLYVGSRRSQLMLRVYDKSEYYGESLGQVWRYEIEVKGVRAARISDGIEKVARDVCTYSIDSVQKVATEFHLSFPHYAEADISTVLKGGVRAATEVERHYWLFKTAAPAVKRALEDKEIAQLMFDTLALGRFVGTGKEEPKTELTRSKK